MMGHHDVGQGLAEGRHGAVDEPAATGQRLKERPGDDA
jgi:hypothetical protein